jgi:glycosyltransferase involved in cell wall biosynthesis
MQERPFVTVVTATYNWPSVLRLAIQTVLQQTFRDFEYIIVGDCCTDETEEVVRSFDDPRIIWRNLPVNSGNQAFPNQVGLEMARGQVVAYMNHDDLWFPDHLETLQAEIRSGHDIVSSLAIQIPPPGEHYYGVLGLPYPTAEGGFEPTWAVATSVMHTLEAAHAVGGWRDWRELEEVPTVEFFQRIRRRRGAHAVLQYATALKFHSADRPGSYRRKDAGEQEYYTTRMQTDPELRHDLLARALVCNSVGMQWNWVAPTAPPGAPPGWRIAQLRRARGLDPMMELGEAATPEAGDRPSPEL